MLSSAWEHLGIHSGTGGYKGGVYRQLLASSCFWGFERSFSRRNLFSINKKKKAIANENGGGIVSRQQQQMGAEDSLGSLSERRRGRNRNQQRFLHVQEELMKGSLMPQTTFATGSPESRGGNRTLAEDDEEKGASPSAEESRSSSTKASLEREEMQPLWKKKRGCELFGVEMNPDTVAIATVYFVQGILGLSRLAVSFFLKDDLHLDPAETALLTGFSAVPWLIKPLYGFLSDGLPLFGYRRRSYLILCGFLGAVSWAALAFFVDNKYTAVAAILSSSLSVAFSDVVVDSMVVERARGESQSKSGSLQSLCWGSSATGGIVSAYFSGYFVQTYGVRFVFGITALLPLITAATAFLVKEESTTSLVGEKNMDGAASELSVLGFLQSSRKQIGFLLQTVREPNILLPTLFIFLWQATPTSETAMFFFTTNKLGFGPEFLGRVRLVTAVASLAGVTLYNQTLKDVPLRKMFFWTTLLGAVLGFSQLVLVTRWNQDLGISDEWFAMGDSLVLTVLGQVSFMPVLVLAAKLCPPGVEATLFAALMSISNGGGVVGGVIGAWVTGILGVTSENFDNLATLVVLCNVTSLLPLPFLGLLPSESSLAAVTDEAEKASNESSPKTD